MSSLFDHDHHGRFLPAGAGLSDEQQAALDLERHIVVIAGAGSGKTRTLARRAVRLLGLWAWERAAGRPAPGAESLLVTTFTDKAAAEIRERIRDELRFVSRALREDEGLRVEAGIDRGQWSRLLDQYAGMRERLDAARIGTFHSLCAAMLREFGVHLGVDPGFRILSGTDQVELAREAVAEGLREAVRDGLPDPGLSWGRARWLEALSTLLAARHDLDLFDFELADLRGEQLAERLTPGASAWIQLLEHELRPGGGLVVALHELRALVPRNDPSRAVLRWLEEVEQGVSAWLNSPNPSWDIIERLTSALQGAIASSGQWRAAHHSWLGAKNTWPKGALEAAAETWGGVRAVLADLFGEHGEELAALPGLADTRALTVVPEVLRAARLVRDRYHRKLSEGHWLDFAELEALARRLLAERAEVRQNLRARHPHLFVDEFQDTNAAQWEIAQHIVGVPDARTGLFLVGDPKQAIYRFRGGDVTLFDRARAELGALGGAVVPFNDNHRTAPETMAVINTLFQDLLPTDGPHRPRWEAPFQPLVARRAAQAGAGARRITIHEPEVATWRSPTLRRLDAEAEAVTKVAAAAVAEFSQGDSKTHAAKPSVAILLGRRTHMGVFTAALRRAGVPHVVAAGRGFFAREEVLSIADVLFALTRPEDEVALLGALRGPILGLADPWIQALVHGRRGTQVLRAGWEAALASVEAARGEQQPFGFVPPEGRQEIERLAARFLRWRRAVPRVPLPTLIRHILDDSAVARSAALQDPSGQSLANLDKLIALAAHWGLDVGGGPERFAERILELADEEDREPDATLDGGAPVVLMTIHQSKGLEFETVILPDLGARGAAATAAVLVGRRAEGGIPLAQAEAGIRLPVARPEGTVEEPTLLRRLIERQAEKEEEAERRRLFYVACTRARDRLWFVLAPPPEKLSEATTFAAWIHTFLARNGPEAIPEVQDLSPTAEPAGTEDAPTEGPESAFDFGTLDPLILPAVGELRPSQAASVEVVAEPSDAPSAAAARCLGDLVHACAEDALWSVDGPAAPRIRRRLLGCSEIEARWVKEQLARHLDALRTILPTAVVGGVGPPAVRREVAFRLPTPDGQWMEGRIDLLVRDEAANLWTVIDYKTERQNDAVLLARHGSQVMAYAWAAARIVPELREGRARIAAEIAASATGRRIEVLAPSPASEVERWFEDALPKWGARSGALVAAPS